MTVSHVWTENKDTDVCGRVVWNGRMIRNIMFQCLTGCKSQYNVGFGLFFGLIDIWGSRESIICLYGFADYTDPQLFSCKISAKMLLFRFFSLFQGNKQFNEIT